MSRQTPDNFHSSFPNRNYHFICQLNLCINSIWIPFPSHFLSLFLLLSATLVPLFRFHSGMQWSITCANLFLSVLIHINYTMSPCELFHKHNYQHWTWTLSQFILSMHNISYINYPWEMFDLLFDWNTQMTGQVESLIW